MSADPVKFFVYGTLRSGNGAHRGFGLDHRAKFLGTYQLEGSIYHLGGYPGVKLDGRPDGFVAELYETTDARLMEQLDSYEGYHEDNPDRSLYIRQTVERPDFGSAYIYEYNQQVGGSPRLESGDWNKRT